MLIVLIKLTEWVLPTQQGLSMVFSTNVVCVKTQQKNMPVSIV